jgi:hypothetical protein
MTSPDDALLPAIPSAQVGVRERVEWLIPFALVIMVILWRSHITPWLGAFRG